MGAELKVTIGFDDNWPVQCWFQGARTPATFGASDTITAYVYRGQDQSPLFSLGTAPYTDGTGTGYPGGQVKLTITAANSALLEPNGTYQVRVSWTPQGTSFLYNVWSGRLTAEPAAGAALQAVTPYCTLADMLLHAPAITQLAGTLIDQEGFYSQRLAARTWLNDIIVKAWRGTSAAYFGDAGRAAQFWLGGWVRRTPLRSQWLMNMLSGGFVITATVTAAGTGYFTAPIVTGPAPPPGTGALPALYSAVLNGTGGIGSITVNQQGLGYTPGSVLTLTITPVSGGSGATATGQVSAGTLLLRPDIVRLCAYKAIAYVGLSQVATNNQLAALGQYFNDQANVMVDNTVAELDLAGTGIASLPIPLVASNTLWT